MPRFPIRRPFPTKPKPKPRIKKRKKRRDSDPERKDFERMHDEVNPNRAQELGSEHTAGNTNPWREEPSNRPEHPRSTATGQTFRTAPNNPIHPSDSLSMNTFGRGSTAHSFGTNDHLAGVTPSEAKLREKEARKARRKKIGNKAKQVGAFAFVATSVGEFISGRVDRSKDDTATDMENRLRELEEKDPKSEEISDLRDIVQAGRVEMLKKEEERKKKDKANFVLGAVAITTAVVAMGAGAIYGYNWWWRSNKMKLLEQKESERQELETQLETAIEGSENEIIWRDKLQKVNAEIRILKKELNLKQG